LSQSKIEIHIVLRACGVFWRFGNCHSFWSVTAVADHKQGGACWASPWIDQVACTTTHIQLQGLRVDVVTAALLPVHPIRHSTLQPSRRAKFCCCMCSALSCCTQDLLSTSPTQGMPYTRTSFAHTVPVCGLLPTCISGLLRTQPV